MRSVPSHSQLNLACIPARAVWMSGDSETWGFIITTTSSLCDCEALCRNATWSLANENPLLIKANTAVKIDCGGQSIDLRSNNGNMTMERGSSLEYQDCLVVDYDYPDYQSLYGSVHSFKDTLISMDSCQVRANLYYEGLRSPAFPEHCAQYFVQNLPRPQGYRSKVDFHAVFWMPLTVIGMSGT